jgi:hypothetical protein
MTRDNDFHLKRPDKGGYIVDLVPDTINLEMGDGEIIPIEVCQIWTASNRPSAHNAPELRSFLAYLGQYAIAALVRRNSSDAFVLYPPAITGKGWVKKRGTLGQPLKGGFYQGHGLANKN